MAGPLGTPLGLADAGRDWGQEEKGRQRIRWLDGIADLMDVSLSEFRAGGVCSRLEPGWLAFRGPSAPRLSQGTGMVARPQSRPNRRVRIAAEQCTIKDPLLFSSVEAK